MTVKLGMTHAQLIDAINSDIGLIKDQGSKIITKEFPASETETSSVQLDTKCQGKDYMFVFMDYGILEPSKYSLSADGLTVNFSPAIPANHKLLVRYFSYINLATIPNGLFLGQIIQVPFGIDESKNIGRYLNGQVIIQEQFPAFTAEVKSWVSTRSSLFTTETEWQQIKSSSKLGQCGKFVIDDTAGTIRLPCVVNINGLVDLANCGVVKNESLPNITGTGYFAGTTGQTTGSGAFSTSVLGAGIAGTSASQYYKPYLDASGSSSAYQDNAPVQQEAVQYPYCIVVNVGVEETLPAIREYKTNVPYVLGDSKYFEANPYNASWLESSGQYNASTVYPDLWSQLQVELNSSLNVGDTIEISGKTYVKRGLPVELSSAAYTDYDFVVNQNDQTFRLPLLNGEEDLVDSRHNNLTLGENGTTYTAPANGWFFFAVQGPTTYFFLVNQTLMDATGTEISSCSSSEGGYYRVCIPVKRGDIARINYDGTITNWANCNFIYAQGNGSLYYYVGDTVQDASLINAGAVLGQLANVNAPSRGYVVESYHNGTEWYRVYSDGWIEQGGLGPANSGNKTITLYKPYSNANYTIIQTPYSASGAGSYSSAIKSQTNTSFVLAVESAYGNGFYWKACGY